jgi:hypothetical protein
VISNQPAILFSQNKSTPAKRTDSTSLGFAVLPPNRRKSHPKLASTARKTFFFEGTAKRLAKGTAKRLVLNFIRREIITEKEKRPKG